MNIWWCSPNGNNVFGVGSRENPFQTIEKALSVFQDGDQIRLLPGTFTPTDSVLISGKSGSIFADVPKASFIQPQKTLNHRAGIAVIDAERFTIAGIVLLQASDSSGNLMGIYVNNIEKFLCLTCDVKNFTVPSGDAIGIFASGGGRVENCTVSNLNGAGNKTIGIWTIGIVPIDCHTEESSGVNYFRGMLIEGLNYP
ncbi:MAG: hypothetical protein WC444_05170 [Candidatus Paceibacterota bacterium]